MSQLFFFTLRDVKFRNKTKYTGLIPKLYSHIYDDDLTIDKIIDYDKLTKNKKEDKMQKDTFKKLLNSMGYKIREENDEVFFKYISTKTNKKIFNKKNTKENPFEVLKNLNLN